MRIASALSLLMWLSMTVLGLAKAEAAPFACVDEAKSYVTEPSQNGYGVLAKCISVANAIENPLPDFPKPGKGNPAVYKSIDISSANAVLIGEWMQNLPKNEIDNGGVTIQQTDPGKVIISGSGVWASQPSLDLSVTK